MRTARLWLGLLLLLALPSMADAQHSRGQHRGLNGAVERLYENRERVEMRADHRARVEQIKEAADARKQPLWQQVVSIRRDLKERRKANPDMPEAECEAMVKEGGERIESLLQDIRGIDHSAMREIGSVLRPQQKEMLREMISRNRGERDGPDQPSERARTRD